MKCVLIIILLLLICISCKNSPDIYFGQTYLQKHKIKSPPAEVLDSVSKQERQEKQGVYWTYLYATKKYPALIFKNPQDHLIVVLLSDSLKVPFGDFISVVAAPFDTLVSLGYSYTKNITMFRVKNYNVEKDTHTYLQQAQNDYTSCWANLKERTNQPGSKLKWPEQPDWQLFVDKERSKVVTFFSAADLMYAVDVNLVYDLKSKNLAEIYAHEWFKGE